MRKMSNTFSAISRFKRSIIQKTEKGQSKKTRKRNEIQGLFCRSHYTGVAGRHFAGLMKASYTSSL